MRNTLALLVWFKMSSVFQRHFVVSINKITCIFVCFHRDFPIYVCEMYLWIPWNNYLPDVP